MVGSFKTILNSTNNIITRNPRVQERFDLPYLLCYQPVRMGADDGGLALCKLMPLDNDTCDVKMPSLKGKAWAGANGDWVFYIGYTCERELLNVYTRHRIPLPKISECHEVEHTDDLRMFKYDHGGCRLRKIAICRVHNRSWNYRKYEVVAIFDKLVAVITDSMVRPWILLKNQFLYTRDEYYDAIEYEDLVFASTTRGTVFAWDPRSFGPVNIPPPILEYFYNQGGDNDGDGHEHEDEEGPYTQWRLTTSDGSPLLVCIQPTADVTTKEAGVFSHGLTLRTYSNTRCMVFGMDTTVLAPTPSPWYNIDSLGENSLFLGQNYPMMVKSYPAAVDTMLLPFMRSNYIYTSDIAVVPYPGRDIIGHFSLDDQSCVGLEIDSSWPFPENH